MSDLLSVIGPIADWSALHEEERVKAVFAGWRGGKTVDALCIYGRESPFNGQGGDVVTFVNNDNPVAPCDVVHCDNMRIQTLNGCDIYFSGQRILSAAKSTNLNRGIAST